jgi:hypothetical protein
MARQLCRFQSQKNSDNAVESLAAIEFAGFSLVRHPAGQMPFAELAELA